MTINSFFKLKNVAINKLVDGLAIDTSNLEKEMEKHILSTKFSQVNLDSKFKDVDEQLLMNYVPFFQVRDSDKILQLTDKYSHIKGPCAMSVDSIEELSEHVANAYQVSYFHYILGKKHNLGGNFPNKVCSNSSKNVVLSLFEKGYPNAAYAQGTMADHAYVILPFVFQNEKNEGKTKIEEKLEENAEGKIEGIVIVDPTYDQLHFSNGVRNAVIIKLGTDWDYKDPKSEGNLFPGIVCSIDSVRKNLFYDISHCHYGKSYLKEAFSNPVKINLENIK